MVTSSNGKFSALLALYEGNPPVIGGFPSHRPVAQSFDIFFDLRMNKPLSKQSRRWWFEIPSCSLSRHCNGGMIPHLPGHRSFDHLSSCWITVETGLVKDFSSVFATKAKNNLMGSTMSLCWNSVPANRMSYDLNTDGTEHVIYNGLIRLLKWWIPLLWKWNIL